MFGLALLIFQELLNMLWHSIVTVLAQPVGFGSFALAMVTVSVSHRFTNTFWHRPLLS